MNNQKKSNHKGLTIDEALKKQEQFGKNRLTAEKKESFLLKIIQILIEPMFLLLIIASVVYFILGEPIDGSIMLIFVLVIITIEVIQEWKTDQTLNALKDLSAPKVKVLRDNHIQTILSEELVPGDVMYVEEGCKVPADGFIIKANDLRIDESSLTGETLAVFKQVNNELDTDDYWRNDYCYTGTLVTTGSGTILVDKIGLETEYGKIGSHLAKAIDTPTPLEIQTNKIVKISAVVATILFIMVSFFTFLNESHLELKDRMIQSILSGVTLAMAMIPEEFPVVLTVFLSMGAWRLAKKKSLIRKLPAVETMGAVSVLCVDKTGTVTKNEMTVTQLISSTTNDSELTELMGLACETDPYDPMEIAMLNYCEHHNMTKKQLFSGELITEYPFTDELKMMGHVWKKQDNITIAIKGSPESVLGISNLSKEGKSKVLKDIELLSKQGLRVIAVGSMDVDNIENIPIDIESCHLKFVGLVGLEDPPRENVREHITQCQSAGIRVVMITGDNGLTASAIANQVGIKQSEKVMTGQELDELTNIELQEAVKYTNVFSRVTPEHKMRIVKAFKENTEVVAMTGDGVNDAPALRYADIGIAMGEHGSEVSREAADLILMDDNFGTIVTTVQDGRRIYDNIKKAIGYIVVIHIPIALTALLGPLLGITQEALFLLPIHVVLLELVIDPTCAIVLERQPSEQDVMTRSPRRKTDSILTPALMLKSLCQGLTIFAASFSAYYMSLLQDPINDELARTLGLSVLIFANVFLVLVNSSDTQLAIHSLKAMIHDKIIWLVIGITVFGLLTLMYSPVNGILDLAPLSFTHLIQTIALAFISVFWYELVKVFKFRKQFVLNRTIN